MLYFSFKIYNFDTSDILFESTFRSNSLAGLQSFRDFLFELQKFFTCSDFDFIGQHFLISPIFSSEDNVDESLSVGWI